MAYDSNRARSVLFGGLQQLSGGFLGDTWEWDGSYWTQMDDIGPSPRSAHAIVYDSARKVTLLFGGQDGTGLKGDMWRWDGQDWTQLSDSGPSPRILHAMAFDGGRNRTVLFGGSSNGGGLPLQDTWEFDGQDWTQQHDSGPQARSGHAMAYDSANSRVTLFGGVGGSTFGDTWGWDGSAWVQLAEFGPHPRGQAAMSWMGDGIVLFGGILLGGTPSLFADTWEFDGKLWTQRQDIGPGSRYDHSLIFDSGRSQVVLFGGIKTAGGLFIGDTWEHQETPPLSVSSLQIIPNSGAGGDQITATITLSAPASVNGATVQMSFSGQGQTFSTISLPNVAVPAGAATVQAQFAVPNSVLVAEGYSVLAQIAGTQAVSAGFTASIT